MLPACFFVLALLLFFQSASAASLRSCNPHLFADGVPPVPTREQLADICPSLQAYLDCYGKVMEESPNLFEEDNQIFYESLGGLARDICNDASQLHKNYVRSIECFESVKDKFDPCLEAASSVYRKYKRATINESEIEEGNLNEKECFTRGHALTCMTDEISRACEPLQLATYTDLVQRSRYLGKFCYPNTAERLRTLYLDYLNADGSHRETHRMVLEFD